tara:strand:- start:2298 stop:2474 length:177 start_codon:yes stop_codon:yes gene_type:complete
MAEKKQTGKGMESKLKDLKIELLKNPTKRKGIKKEIARLLTTMNSSKGKTQTKLEDKK